MQAQAPRLPYVALWSRLQGFRHDELSRLVENRSAVRMSLMRNTIHLVTTEDALLLKPLFQPLHERGFFSGSPWGRRLNMSNTEAVRAEGRRIMGQRPRTVAELGKLLAEQFPEHDGVALAYAVRYLVPLVFTPPRGTWGGRGLVTLTTVEAWLDRGPGPAISPEDLVLRYLAAFGPASAADMRAWSGLAMRPAFEALRSRLKTFQDERGVELFDLAKAPLPDPETRVPPRFLPDFDNILLAHADRTRIMAPGQHLGLFSSNGVMKGSLLLDGFVRAAWIPERAGKTTTLVVTPFGTAIPKALQPAIAEEGMRLLEFLAPGDKHEVWFAPAK
jgi:hypothetical protein